MFVVEQLSSGTRQGDLAGLQHVGHIGNAQGHVGVTVLLIEQNANMALQTADFGYVLETGRISLSGSGSALLTNEAVKKAYLGE